MTNPLIFFSNSFYFFRVKNISLNERSDTYVKTCTPNERRGKETVC